MWMQKQDLWFRCQQWHLVSWLVGYWVVLRVSGSSRDPRRTSERKDLGEFLPL